MAFSDDVAQSARVLFIATGTLTAGLLGLTVAATAAVSGLMGPDYLELIDATPGGVKGMLRPFRVVAMLCSWGAIASLSLVLRWPLVSSHVWIRGGTGLVALLPVAWCLLAAVQLVELVGFHAEKRLQVLKVVQDVRQRMRA